MKKIFLTCILGILLFTSCHKNTSSIDVISSYTISSSLYITVILHTTTSDYQFYSKEIIQQCLENNFPTTKFSFDTNGYPSEVIATVYATQKDYSQHKILFEMTYMPKDTPSFEYNIKDNSNIYFYDISH